jgi:hypothetical protein
MGPEPSPELTLLTLEEVREILHFKHVQSVRDAIHRGALPAVRVGKRYFVRVGALVRLFEEQERARTAPSGEQAARILARHRRQRKRHS